MSKGGFRELASEAIQMPKEAILHSNKTNTDLTIGIPCENIINEKRVAFTPEAVKVLYSTGYKVFLESGAGSASKFSDHEYSEAGAIITRSKEEAFSCDFVVKIALPDEKEIELFHPGQILISALNPPHVELNLLHSMLRKKISAYCFEKIRDDSGSYPIIQSMSEIAGRTAIFIASEYLSNNEGKGILLGGVTGIPPARVVIIGAGTVGQHAAKTSLALGAEVMIFDHYIYKLRRLSALLPFNVRNSLIQPYALTDALKNADVAIGALRPEQGRTPSVVTEEMVSQMKEKSIIIDVSIDQGGCFETSELTSIEKPVFTKYNVIHYCVPNIPSIVPQTASTALSNSLLPIFTSISKYGDFQTYLWDKTYSRYGLYIYKGILTDSYLGEKFNMDHKNIDILLTSFI